MAETLGSWLSLWVARARERPATAAPPEAETLGMRLRRLRGERRLTLRKVVAAAGVSLTYLHQLETDKSVSPSAHVTIRLARLYGVTVEQLMEGLA